MTSGIGVYPARGGWGLVYRETGEWLANDFGILLTHYKLERRIWDTWNAADGWRARNGLPAEQWEIRRIEPEPETRAA